MSSASLRMTDYPLIGEFGWSWWRDFLKFRPNHIFLISKAREFKFRVLIDEQEY